MVRRGEAGCTRVDAVREAAAGGCGRPRSNSTAGAAASGRTPHGRRRRARGGGGLRGRHRLRRPRRRALLHCESLPSRLAPPIIIESESSGLFRFLPCFMRTEEWYFTTTSSCLAGSLRNLLNLLLWLIGMGYYWKEAGNCDAGSFTLFFPHLVTCLEVRMLN